MLSRRESLALLNRWRYFIAVNWSRISCLLPDIDAGRYGNSDLVYPDRECTRYNTHPHRASRRKLYQGVEKSRDVCYVSATVGSVPGLPRSEDMLKTFHCLHVDGNG